MIYGDIHHQRLKLVNEHIVADTIDYLEMKFIFKTDDWDGLTKWAHFSKNDTVYDIPLTDGCIRKEDHLNLSAGVWSVYLHGNAYENGEVVERITTDIAPLYVHPTGTLDGEPFPEIPASVVEQINARLARLESGGTGGGTGGGSFTPGNALELTPDGILNVKTTDTAEADNTLPITSAGVNTIIGNIGAILDTI